MKNYKAIGKIGEGTFSEVMKMQSLRDGNYYACKQMKQHFESIEQVNNLREIQALRRLNPHPNIVTLHEVAFSLPYRLQVHYTSDVRRTTTIRH